MDIHISFSYAIGSLAVDYGNVFRDEPGRDMLRSTMKDLQNHKQIPRHPIYTDRFAIWWNVSCRGRDYRADFESIFFPNE